MQIEYIVLLANKTWELVNRPIQWYISIGKWAFKKKSDIYNQVKRYKARWIRQGIKQREETDYFETFATVIKTTTNKTLFAISANKKLHFYQLDIVIPFLNSCLNIEIYIEQPEIFHNGNYNQVLRLCRSFYRLKQLARLWFNLFAEKMLALRFFLSQQNSALFLNSKKTHVVIYINDFQRIGSDLAIIGNLKTNLSQKFKMTDFGPTLYYLSMDVNISVGKVVMTWKTYVKKLFDLHQMSDCNFLPISMIKKLNLKPKAPDFISDATNIIAYKQFTRFVQQLICQIWLDIIQTILKFNQHNVKPIK